MKDNCMYYVLAFFLFTGNVIETVAQEQKKDSTNIVVPSIGSKEEKNRNEMLNAESTTSPRNVNIGLPFAGDIVILENGVPVVYYFYPTSPVMAWNYDNSMGKMGLLSFAEGAIAFGKVGYAVSSEDRYAGSKFRGYASIMTNNYGGVKYDITLTGPLNRKGWGYTLSTYQSFDKGPINYMYTSSQERVQMYKASIQKKYKKGDIRVLAKYVDGKRAAGAGNYPLTYLGDGETTSLPNFELGKDSYTIRDGLVPYYNPHDGQQYTADLNSDEFSRSQSYNVYLQGNHKFDNGWKLSYTSMYQYMNSPLVITFPLSLGIRDANPDSYFIAGTNGGQAWDGDVQMVVNQIIPQSSNTSVLSRAEITKKINGHDLRFGLTHMYNHRKLTTYGGIFLQTVEANPRLIDWYSSGYKITNNGLIQNQSYGSTTDDAFNRTAFYVSDDFKPTKWLELGLAGRIEHQNKRVVYDPYQYGTEYIGDKPLIAKNFNNKWNKVGAANAVVKLTRNFGLLGDITYNSWHDTYFDYTARDADGNPIAAEGEDYPRQTVGNDFEVAVTNFGGGVYWNHSKNLSVVSKITRIYKSNLRGGGTITNPLNTEERKSFDPIFYNLSTWGWSTDIVAAPFKNFDLHFLLTLQDPKYKNYKYSAFNVTYDYSNNTIPELSKILMEIDASYMLLNSSLKLWASLRYFGKAYANATNAFYYNPRWENFGGVDYTVSRNLTLKMKVINFLDQKGVKGALQGADQITSDADYIGKTVVANSILPRTIEFSASVKF